MSDSTTTLLIYGASGDLTSRLLLPGLGTLLAAEPERRIRVVGADRADLSQAEWHDKLRTALVGEEVPAERIEQLLSTADYHHADLLDEAQLGQVIAAQSAPLVMYFALPPQITIKLCALLEQMDLPQETRLALEKPFGHDAQSARQFNAQLLRVVPESHIHRIDHFLGVATVLNLMGVRFANRLMEPIWSAEHIERVDIFYHETLALEGRAGYYDGAGALKDMLQSHLLQILAFFAMETPAVLSADEVQSLKAQMLRATHLWGGDPQTASRRARYSAGTIDGREILDYSAEDGVDPSRQTETLAEIVLGIDNARWSGVPFVLRSGKALGEARKEIIVTFRPPRHLPTGLKDNDKPDRLVLELKPGALTLDLAVNAEGDPFALEQKSLTAELGKARMLPYGEMLGGILDGNALLSIRGDVAEECWRIVEPALQAWSAGDVPLQEYPAGSAGPEGWGVIPN